jgi:hypothetical protein
MTRAPYLVVDDREDRNYKYRLSWYIPEDNGIGGSVGDVKHTESDLKTVDADAVDAVIAYLTASKLDGVLTDHAGFYWESRAKAQAALRVVKAAIAAGADRPMPDWAQKALAAGWKAPKGWRP